MSELTEQIHEYPHGRGEDSLERNEEIRRKEQDLKQKITHLSQDEAEEDAERLEAAKKLKPKKLRNRCLYLTMLECLAPQCAPELCQACPYGFLYCLPLMVKELYHKVVSFSVILASQEQQFALLLAHGGRVSPRKTS